MHQENTTANAFTHHHKSTRIIRTTTGLLIGGKAMNKNTCVGGRSIKWQKNSLELDTRASMPTPESNENTDVNRVTEIVKMTSERSISITRKSKMPDQAAHSQLSHIPGHLVNEDTTHQSLYLPQSRCSSCSFPNKDPLGQLRRPHTPCTASPKRQANAAFQSLKPQFPPWNPLHLVPV